MSNLIIYHTKESNVEFNVEVSGVDTKDMVVRFVIEAADMSISFKCKNEKQNTWSCKLPPMRFLEKTTYPYTIEVCADGYYLNGASGTITVVATAEIYTSEPKNKTIPAPAVKDEKETKKIKLDKNEEKADQKEEKQSESKSKTEKTSEQFVLDKDSIVKSILKETVGDRKPRKPLFKDRF